MRIDFAHYFHFIWTRTQPIDCTYFKTPNSLNNKHTTISDKMVGKKEPREGKYDKAALFFNVLKLFPPTATFSISQVMEAKQFTCEEAQDHTLRQRVCCEAQCKDLRDAAFQIVLTAAREFIRTRLQ